MDGNWKYRLAFFGKKEDRAALEQYRALIRDLEALREEILRVDSNFNMTADEDLVESYIYESNALAARYRYLLKEAREQKIRLENAGVLQTAQGVMG